MIENLITIEIGIYKRGRKRYTLGKTHTNMAQKKMQIDLTLFYEITIV
jgi:hypothetical protein